MQDVNRCQQLIEEYASAIREGSQAASADDACLIVTPFTRPDGGMVEIEVQALPDGQLRISDLGESIGYLYVNGLTLNSQTLAEVRRYIRQYDVQLAEYELLVQSESVAAAGEQFHALIQAVLRVTDMIQKRRPYQRVRFDDVVESFLVGNRAVNDYDFEVQGESSKHKVRFHVDSARKLLVQPLTATNEQIAFSWAERWAYRFDDIKRRDASWRPFVVLDDRGDKASVWTSRTLIPLRRDTTIVRWADPAALAEAVSGDNV